MVFENILLSLAGNNLLLLGLLGGCITALLNAIGAIPVLFFKKLPERVSDIGLGFAAGVMLAASFTSLIVPGIEKGGINPVIIGIVLGALSVNFADMIIPHMHMIIGKEGISSSRLRGIWLFVLAITLHNMPEGLAVGVGFGSGNLDDAVVLMLAIGLQNIPEGLSVGFSILAEGNKSRFYAFLIAIISGLVEPPLSLIGAATVAMAHQVLPYAMGFAAGAMIFVISDEIIPETNRVGHERYATYGLIIGFIIMLYMDVILG
ncbi:MAG: ZIP family metal transporter [Thermoproteales archaeon]|nr:ZIP family metal transporter [Thermoproteales archaeon]